MKQRLIKLLNLLLVNMKRPLPVGVAEFNAFADRILSMSGKYADEDSMRFALAGMIIYLKDGKDGTPCDRAPDAHFLASLRKSAANQVASHVCTQIKTKQAEDMAARKQAEATANTEAASDDNQAK